MPTIEFVDMRLAGDIAFYNFSLNGPGNERVGLIPIQTVCKRGESFDDGKARAAVQLKLVIKCWAEEADKL
ncbi:hypothetical protein [Devosia sp. SD17-2]|uniref:hypothetical protein n=1 Tax=Devosia sp. SD17-2 TaxID=2976459 RepID=UPI0023D81C42|nr:hypothetical protein [Devosia sp. SD17-2]WEJ35056.1 hypothetical protein NYQ88_09790 [Devosia sp. SD17-2]